MRRLTFVLLAATVAATPAAAQQTTETPATDTAAVNQADPSLAPDAVDTNMGLNATMPGLAGGPQEAQGPSTVAPAPDMIDATVTPETNEGPGFPWGILGLLGLVGLIGRFRSRSREA